MKLFLASSFAQTSKLLEQRLQKPIKGKKIVFIANPADYSTGDKWWIKADRDAFIKLGCNVIDVDLRTISDKDLKKYLETSDIIHLCGGSVFYTILLIKEKGFDNMIKEFIEKDKIIYSGTSAGSMIVSEDLSLDASDPEEKQERKIIETEEIYLPLIEDVAQKYFDKAKYLRSQMEKTLTKLKSDISIKNRL